MVVSVAVRRVARFAGAAIDVVVSVAVRRVARFGEGAVVSRLAAVLRFAGAAVSRLAAVLRFGAAVLRLKFGAAVLRVGAIVAALMRGVVELLAMAAPQSKSMTCDWGLTCRGALVELKRAAYGKNISACVRACVRACVHDIVCMYACIARSGLHRSGDCVALRVVGECVGGKCVVAFVASRA